MKNFTIANLMTGDLVTLRNGKTGTVMLNTRIGDIIRYHSEKNSFSYIAKRFNADLTHNKHSNMDIVKVTRVDAATVPMNKIGDLIANPEKMIASGKVIFDRDALPVKPKLADLVTGDLLIHRNGKISTVYKDTPIGDIIRYYTENNSFSYLSRYNDDLVHESKDGFDIVGVLRIPDSVDSTKIGDYIANPAKILDGDNVRDCVVWVSEDINTVFYYNGDDYHVKHSVEFLTDPDYDPDSEDLADILADISEDMRRDFGIHLSPDDEDDLDDRADEIDELRELIEELSDRLDDLS